MARRWRRLLPWAGAALAFVAVLAGALFLAATPILRSVLESQLADLGIKTGGLETLRANLVSGEASVGPGRLGEGPSAATFERLAIEISLTDLLQKRIHFARIELDGAELGAERTATGGLVLSGFPPDLFESGEDDGDDGEPSQWTFGAEAMVITGSRFVINDFGGGELETVMARVAAGPVLEWSPDTPAVFDIDATLNGAALRYKGEATPLADAVSLRLDGGFEGLTWERITRFAGEDDAGSGGGVPIAGSLRNEMLHELLLHPDGSLEGRSEGVWTLAGFGIEIPDGEAAALAELEARLDLRFGVDDEKRPFVEGDLTLSADAGEIDSPEGDRITFAIAELGGSGMRLVDVSSGDRPDFIDAVLARAKADGGGADGPPSLAQIIVDLALAAAEELLRQDLEITGHPNARIEGLTARLQSDDIVSDMRLAAVSADAPGLDVGVSPERWRMESGLSTTASGYEAETSALGRVFESRIDETSVAVERLAARGDADGSVVEISYELRVTGVENSDDAGGRLSIGSLAVSAPKSLLAGSGGFRGEASGPFTVTISGIDAAEAGAVLSGESLALDMTRFDVGRGEDATAVAEGRIDAAGWRLEGPDGGVSAGAGTVSLTFPPTMIAVTESGVSLRREGAEPVPGAAAPEETATETATEAAPEIAAPGEPAPATSPPPIARPAPGNGDVDPGFEAPKVENPPRMAALPRPRPANRAEAVEEVEAAEDVEDVAAADAEPEAPTPDEAPPPDGAVLSMETFDLRAPGAGGPVTVEAAGARLTAAAFDLTAGEALRAVITGGAELAGLSATGGGASGRVETLSIAAERLTVEDSGAGPAISAKTSVRVGGISGGTPKIAGRAWKYRASGVALDVSGTAGAGGVEGGGSASATGLKVEGVGDEPDHGGAEIIELAGIRLSPGGVSIGSARVQGLDALLTRSLIDSFAEGPDGEGSDGEGAGAATPLRIAELTIAPGGRVVYADPLPSGIVRVSVDVGRWRTGPFDLSDPGVATAFDIALTVNETARLDMSGEARLLASPLLGRATARLSDMSLPAFSPYLEEAIRFHIASGVLNSTAEVTASAGALEGLVELDLRDFVMDPLDAAAEAAFQSEFVVSSRYALEVLRGMNGDIRLSIPLRGTPDAPELVMDQVMSSATTGVISSLIPFNWLRSDDFSMQEYPVEFAAGSAETPAAALDFLARGAARLEREPDLRVSVCGVATPLDIAVLRDAPPTQSPAPRDVAEALDLAAAREQAVRAVLEGEHGMAPDRLSQCKSEFRTDGGAPGVVFRVQERGG